MQSLIQTSYISWTLVEGKARAFPQMIRTAPPPPLPPVEPDEAEPPPPPYSPPLPPGYVVAGLVPAEQGYGP